LRRRNQPRDLPLEGRNLRGVHFAMEFLHANTRVSWTANTKTAVTCPRKIRTYRYWRRRYGTDCVGTALRQGCRSLIQFESCPNHRTSAPRIIPGHSGPKSFGWITGTKEAAARFGRDPRVYSILSKRFIGDEGGSFRAVETVEVDLAAPKNGRGGRMKFREAAENGRHRWFCLPLVSGTRTKGLLDQLGVVINDRGNVAVDDDVMTSAPKVFAAGDMTRGQSLVVWAIAMDAARQEESTST